MGKRGRGDLIRWCGALCLLGVTLSAYSLYVELAKARDPSYRAFCDIAAQISCSIVFTSEYGTGFGIIGKLLGEDSWLNVPNGVFGLFMYPVAFLSIAVPNLLGARIGVMIGVGGVAMSIYLGYVLFIILKDACVVCITTYIVNILYFYFASINYKELKATRERKSTAALKKGS